MLEVREANVFYGKRQILFDINLQLKNGLYGMIGENGAGKTTLISVMTGLIKPTSGEVIWDGRDISSYGRNIMIL